MVSERVSKWLENKFEINSSEIIFLDRKFSECDAEGIVCINKQQDQETMDKILINSNCYQECNAYRYSINVYKE